MSGISGLQNFQERMDVIGNNIANVNTSGFKAGRTVMTDSFSNTLQSATGSSGVQVGTGVATNSIQNMFTQGSLASTGNTVKKTIRLEEGDFVITPRGCIAEFKVLPGSDLRRVCGLMPGYALHPYIVERNKKEAAETAAKAGK